MQRLHRMNTIGTAPLIVILLVMSVSGWICTAILRSEQVVLFDTIKRTEARAESAERIRDNSETRRERTIGSTERLCDERLERQRAHSSRELSECFDLVKALRPPETRRERIQRIEHLCERR